MTEWLASSEAQTTANLLFQQYGERAKACHIQGMGTGGRLKITLFLTPLATKEIPEPQTFIFNAPVKCG